MVHNSTGNLLTGSAHQGSRGQGDCHSLDFAVCAAYSSELIHVMEMIFLLESNADSPANNSPESLRPHFLETDAVFPQG